MRKMKILLCTLLSCIFFFRANAWSPWKDLAGFTDKSFSRRDERISSKEALKLREKKLKRKLALEKRDLEERKKEDREFLKAQERVLKEKRVQNEILLNKREKELETRRKRERKLEEERVRKEKVESLKREKELETHRKRERKLEEERIRKEKIESLKREKEIKEREKVIKAEEQIRNKKIKENQRLELKRIEDLKRSERRRIKFNKSKEDDRVGKWDYVYTLTSWPFNSLYSKKKDFINFALNYQYATKGYSSSNHSQDISNLIFTEGPIRVQDILLVSKLLKDGKVDANVVPSNYYLYYLADERISFDASFEEIRGCFDYSRKFNHDISFGIQIPFAHREHKLELRTHLTQANLQKLEADTNVIAQHQDFTNFIKDILNNKGINYHPKNSTTGIGDIASFLNIEIKSKELEHFIIGIKAQFPTSRDRDIHKLWDAELGNGGFTELSIFAGLLYKGKNFLNPHLFAKATYDVPAYVDRRVPRRRTYSGQGGGTDPISSKDIETLDGIVFSDKVNFKLNTAFDSIGSSIRRFAIDTTRIKMYRGGEVNLRVGNIIKGFLSKAGFLDLFYDMRAKGRDYASARLDENTWDASILTQNSYEIEHRVGLNLSYHFDEHFRGELGGLYTFAGRNVPEVFEIDAALKWEF
ncbi:hypothetical protein KAW80_03680 [Candidatus Babeliales bacterium]|nr:hypothetical protein [Candidatus Babeliales bacterium]